MKKLKLFLAALLISFCFCQSFSLPGSPITVEAHSGRTDSHGGHKDNKNKSGLGSYHYHHGYPAHLHPNGICPYSSGSTTTQSRSSATQSDSAASTASEHPAGLQVSLTQKYSDTLTDFNNKVINNYFKENIKTASANFLSAKSPLEQTQYLNSLLTASEANDLLPCDTAEKQQLYSTITYLRMYDQIEAQAIATSKTPSSIAVPAAGIPSVTASAEQSAEQDAIVLSMVTQLQTHLTNLGLYTGNIDGVFDTNTQQSLLAFQKMFGITEDGIINQDVIQILKISI